MTTRGYICKALAIPLVPTRLLMHGFKGFPPLVIETADVLTKLPSTDRHATLVQLQDLFTLEELECLIEHIDYMDGYDASRRYHEPH